MYRYESWCLWDCGYVSFMCDDESLLRGSGFRREGYLNEARYDFLVSSERLCCLVARPEGTKTCSQKNWYFFDDLRRIVCRVYTWNLKGASGKRQGLSEVRGEIAQMAIRMNRTCTDVQIFTWCMMYIVLRRALRSMILRTSLHYMYSFFERKKGKHCGGTWKTIRVV